ncbi:hypothetical protein RCL_jg12524.t1 [Rhizophagus clarus]|uniref:Uncharacterized protein n=1 Tax=Rhizophagus clarus TaxID=94130 RepID=A0A8H3QSB5_9GLOM|nr:hypothetical protein RCL_jg12524.t1 [Rhizophagus clarus]
MITDDDKGILIDKKRDVQSFIYFESHTIKARSIETTVISKSYIPIYCFCSSAVTWLSVKKNCDKFLGFEVNIRNVKMRWSIEVTFPLRN